MAENRNSMVAVAILITLVGVLLSCCVGTVGGLVAGGLRAERQLERVERRLLQRSPSEDPDQAPILPGPRPELPREPQLPLEPRTAPEGFEDTTYAGGALILRLRLDGAALNSGMRRNDVIVAVGDVAITPEVTLADAVRGCKPGDRVQIRYWRKGEEMTASVRLVAHPDNPDAAYLGIDYAPVAARSSGED